MGSRTILMNIYWFGRISCDPTPYNVMLNSSGTSFLLNEVILANKICIQIDEFYVYSSNTYLPNVKPLLASLSCQARPSKTKQLFNPWTLLVVYFALKNLATSLEKNNFHFTFFLLRNLRMTDLWIIFELVRAVNSAHH